MNAAPIERACMRFVSVGDFIQTLLGRKKIYEETGEKNDKNRNQNNKTKMDLASIEILSR